MSTNVSFSSSLILAQTYLYRFGGPILLAIGTISSVFSLIVFSKKNLRKSTCSNYFIALNISNILLIYLSLLPVVLANGYNINPGLYNLGFCRAKIYISAILDILGPFYLILAAIDRVLVTSSRVQIRRCSTHNLAYKCIIIGTLFWFLIQLHTLFYAAIVELAPNNFFCYFSSNTYLLFSAYYSFIIKGILAPVLLIIFSLWSIKNVRSVRRVRVGHVLATNGTISGYGSHIISLKERQLLIILLIDISVYIVFSWMYPIFSIYLQMKPSNMKNLIQRQIDVLISLVSVFSVYIPFCTGFYTNLLASTTFRNEVKKLFYK